MQFGEILTSIRAGDYDETLLDIQRAIIDRQEMIGRVKFAALQVGDEVHFNDNVKKNLAGLPVTVIEKRRSNVVVRTEAGDEYVGNPSLLRLP